MEIVRDNFTHFAAASGLKVYNYFRWMEETSINYPSFLYLFCTSEDTKPIASVYKVQISLE